MIALRPNKRYKIFYGNGNVYSYGDTSYFETLDLIPQAKHLIQVKDNATGKIIDLTDLLCHPWINIEEVAVPADDK